jgi:hypothetical protein
MTITAAAGVLSAPEPPNGPGPGGTSDDTEGTITWADFTAGLRALERTGGCTHPVRLRGRIEAIDRATGELGTMYDTATEPGGVLLTACGNRRESVCPACSQVYKRDARQLVRTGLTGGKGIPETIAEHPCVFATLTAPSFGPVHSRRMRGKTVLPCRPRRDASSRRCPHGRDISCSCRHGETDPRLGRALCGDCYDYAAAVLFNAYAGNLWRRFTTYLPRTLAHQCGITQKALRDLVRIRYVKVAEYQARGVVHFHAVIRLDASGEDYQPPAATFTADLLCQAITNAAAAARLDLAPNDDHPALPVLTLTFGAQTDTRIVRASRGLPGTGHRLGGRAVANYIAKYATKTLDAPGLPEHRIRDPDQISDLSCSRHYRQMITAAWRIGTRHAIAIRAQRPTLTGNGTSLAEAARAWQSVELAASAGEGRLCKWAHTLGFGGHFLTKSRGYSTSFGALRRARTEHRRQQRHPGEERDPWGRPLDERVVLVVETWDYGNTGYTTPGAQMALASVARARNHDHAANAA